jgi:hypothetical protein
MLGYCLVINLYIYCGINFPGILLPVKSLDLVCNVFIRSGNILLSINYFGL